MKVRGLLSAVICAVLAGEPVPVCAQVIDDEQAVFVPRASGGGGGFSHTLEQIIGQNTGFTASATYSSVPFGAASSDRIIAFLGFSDHGGLTGAKVNGVAATTAKIDTSGEVGSFYANITTGTSGTIELDGSGLYDTSIVVEAIHGQIGGGSASPTATPTTFVTSGTPEPIPVPFTVATGGFSLMAGMCTSATTNTFTWTVATGVGTPWLQTGGFTPVTGAAEGTASGTATAATTGAVCAYGNGTFGTIGFGP
jgi:hypothetical protein